MKNKLTQEPDAARSRTMRAVKSQDTKPEMLVRRLVHAMGFRYRLHGKILPGTPDLVFASRRKVIFVHGCFWHGHDCKRGARVPKANTNYWIEKVERNQARDLRVESLLKEQGWEMLTIWECETKDVERLQQLITGFLQSHADQRPSETSL